MSSTHVGRRVGLDAGSLRLGLAVVALEALLVAAYFDLTTATVTEPRYLVYPFVWINAGVWAVLRTTPRPGNRLHRLLGLSVAVGYFLVLLAVPGNVGLTGDGPGLAGLRIAWYAPGWGPILAFDGPLVRFYLVPFEVVGYAALAYLVYATVLTVSRGALGGLLGLVTCVGCTVPVLAPLVGLLGGPAAGLVTTAYAWSYDLGTLFFLVSLGLLYRAHRRSGGGDVGDHG